VVAGAIGCGGRVENITSRAVTYVLDKQWGIGSSLHFRWSLQAHYVWRTTYQRSRHGRRIQPYFPRYQSNGYSHSCFQHWTIAFIRLSRSAEAPIRECELWETSVILPCILRNTHGYFENEQQDEIYISHHQPRWNPSSLSNSLTLPASALSDAMDNMNGLTMDPNPPPSRNPNIDLLEERSEKEIFKHMPGFVGLRDELDPLKAEADAMRATMSGSNSPVPPVSGPQRVTGECLQLLHLWNLLRFGSPMASSDVVLLPTRTIGPVNTKVGHSGPIQTHLSTCSLWRKQHVVRSP
jgi:hypothetical protein